MANNPPVATILAGSSYAAGTVLTGTQLFSASDTQGVSDIDYIKVYDAGVTGGAVWRYNGSIITPGGAAAGGFQFEYANRGSSPIRWGPAPTTSCLRPSTMPGPTATTRSGASPGPSSTTHRW